LEAVRKGIKVERCRDEKREAKIKRKGKGSREKNTNKK
jgi:hypothetical protein